MNEDQLYVVVLPKYHTDYEIIRKNRIFETSHNDIKWEEQDVKKSFLILDSFEILYLKKLNPIFIGLIQLERNNHAGLISVLTAPLV